MQDRELTSLGSSLTDQASSPVLCRPVGPPTRVRVLVVVVAPPLITGSSQSENSSCAPHSSDHFSLTDPQSRFRARPWLGMVVVGTAGCRTADRRLR